MTSETAFYRSSFASGLNLKFKSRNHNSIQAVCPEFAHFGESGYELILKSTVMSVLVARALKKSDLKRVKVDTTV